MQRFKDVALGTGGQAAARAYREGFLYSLVAYFDEANAISESDTKSITKVNRNLYMTLEQKRRLRNRIFEQAKRIEAEQPGRSSYDPEVLVEAFFNTEFGKMFTADGVHSRGLNGTSEPGSFVRLWQKGGSMFQMVDANVRSWTYDRVDDVAKGRAFVALVSPLDPMFKNSDMFEDGNDFMGYVAGRKYLTDSGEIKSVLFMGDDMRAYQEQRDRLVQSFADKKHPTEQESAQMTAMYWGRYRFVQPYARMEKIANASADYDRALESDLSASGYLDIEHFIRTKDEKKRVKDHLLEMVAPDRTQFAMRPDELQFINSVCNYLYSRGADFTLDVASGHLCALVNNPKMEIRVMSRDDELHLGRIYANGIVTRISVAGDGLNGNANRDRIAAQTVSNEDRLNMIRWYFGEQVRIARDDSTRARQVVGMADRGIVVPTIQTAMNNHRSGKDAKRQISGFVAANQIPSNDATSYSAILAVRKSPETYRKHELVKIFVDRSTMQQETDFDVSLSVNRNLGPTSKGPYATTHLDDLVPASKILPDAIIDEDGHPGLDEFNRNRNYYSHLRVREKLAEWVQSAKDEHRRLMNLDGMVAALKEGIERDEQDNFVFSDDDNVAELQEKAWNYLVKSYDKKNPETLEAAIQKLNEEYDTYQKETFGFVPEIQREGVVVSEIEPEYMGFNPEMTVRYSTLVDAMGAQKNQSFILHMLDLLGDDYSIEPGKQTIRGDEYFTRQVKNAMIRYNAEKTLAEVKLTDVCTNPAMGSFAINEEKFNEYIAQTGLAHQPFRAAALKETLRMLLESGCHPNTIAVRMDSQGIIDYTGCVTGKAEIMKTNDKKTGNEVFYFDNGDADVLKDMKKLASFEDGISMSSLMNTYQFHRVRGQIGQVFEPDGHGAIQMETVVGDDRILIPGYDAYLMPNDIENPKPMAERLRLIGVEQQMMQTIDTTVRASVTRNPADWNFVSHTTDLNAVYSHAYDTVLDKDYYEMYAPKPGTPEEDLTPQQKTFLNVLHTLRGRCRFPNEYGEGSTTMAQSYLENAHTEEAKDFDYFYSDLCENHNLRVLGHQFDGVFDPNATGNAKTQGIVRYLADGATVDMRSGVVKAYDGPDEDMKLCSLMKDPVFENMYFDSWDRRLMAMNQVLTALGTPRQVGTAMMNIKGWNFDDGFLVSKRFAEENMIQGADGEMRPLMAQDKLSDFHGNKGVISRVIDPEMMTDRLIAKIGTEIELKDGSEFPVDLSDKYARKITATMNGQEYAVNFSSLNRTFANKETPAGRSLEDLRKELIVKTIQRENGLEDMDDVMRVFAENPSLDIVQAPYSGMSRFNGGTIRDLMNHTEPLVITKDGKTHTVPGGIGFTNFIVVDMPADVKTHIYDEAAVLEGKGRKASGQLAWALQSKGCVNIMNEFYGKNQGALDDLREYAICLGMDFTPDMIPVTGYHEQTERGEHRSLTKLPDLATLLQPEDPDAPIDYRSLFRKKGKNFKGLDTKLERKIRDDIMAGLNKNGGFMELPFELELQEKDPGAEANEYLTPQTGQVYHVGSVTGPTYGYPVLPINLRSGIELLDGTSRAHDYTNRYVRMYSDAVTYMVCQEACMAEQRTQKELLKKSKTGKVNGLNADDKKLYDESMAFFEQIRALGLASREDAQTQSNAVTKDIINRRFDTKYNVIRESIMAKRIPVSGTAVWSADPRLDLDQVSMNKATAKKLGFLREDGALRRDSRVMIWRDPILHDDNVRYMRVKLDESILGVAINPLMDKCFDGDFDGDSVGVVPLHGNLARAEAYRKFSLESNLLQKGVAPDENGDYPLYIQTGLDVKTVMAGHPELKERYDQLAHEINVFERSIGSRGDDVFAPDAKEIRDKRSAYVRELNKLMHDTLDDIGSACIDFSSEQSVMSSLIDIADTKAKGDRSKLGEFANNFGVQLDGPGVEDGWETKDRSVLLSAIKPIKDKDGKVASKFTVEGTQRQKDGEIQETTAYKADNTALGGVTAQNAVAAFRNKCLTAALELSYPTTQGILQSKHDPKDAKVKDKIVRFWGKDVWDGYELTGVFEGEPSAIINSGHAKKVITVKDSDGNDVHVYKKATPEVWMKQMQGMFKALKVDINPKYLREMVETMTRSEDRTYYDVRGAKTPDGKRKLSCKYGRGTVYGVTEFAEEHGTLMDKVAYSGRFKALKREIRKPMEMRMSLFEDTVVMDRDVEESRRAYRQASKTPEVEQESRDMARVKMQAAMMHLPNSATFLPDTYITETYHDLMRSKNGGVNLAIKGYGENATMVQVDPRPVGNKNCRLTTAQLEEGYAYMGEAEADYQMRLAEAKKRQEVLTTSCVETPATEKDFDRSSETEAIETKAADMEAKAAVAVQKTGDHGEES